MSSHPVRSHDFFHRHEGQSTMRRTSSHLLLLSLLVACVFNDALVMKGFSPPKNPTKVSIPAPQGAIKEGKQASLWQANLRHVASAAFGGGVYLLSPSIMHAEVVETVSSTTVNTRAAASALYSAPMVVAAEQTVWESTCLGFGCGSYNGPDYGGAPKLETGEKNIDMPSFLKLVEEKRIEKVELLEGGNVAYAYVAPRRGDKEGAGEGKEAGAERVRIGEGFPVENGKTWSSPLWMVRILKDKQIPYTLGFDFSGSDKVTRALSGFAN